MIDGLTPTLNAVVVYQAPAVPAVRSAAVAAYRPRDTRRSVAAVDTEFTPASADVRIGPAAASAVLAQQLGPVGQKGGGASSMFAVARAAYAAPVTGRPRLGQVLDTQV